MATQRKAFAVPIRSLRDAPTLLMLLLSSFLWTVSMLPKTNALSGSHGMSTAAAAAIGGNSETASSDRILPPEYYRSVYKTVKQQQQQQQQQHQEHEQDPAPDHKHGGTTPWDIGNHRPQPAIVRAYEEGKLRGHVLDAGCGAGENCVYLAQKYGISSVTGFDLSEDAVRIATERADAAAASASASAFWTKPRFLAASCTEVADRHGPELLEGLLGSDNYDNNNNDNNDNKDPNPKRFDVVVDSGLLHCLSEADARSYVQQISGLLQPNTGRFYIGCFSTANPDPWDNPRRISEDYLRNELFVASRDTGGACCWEVLSCRECWWSRPPSRGSSTGGAFSLALWVEVRLLDPSRCGVFCICKSFCSESSTVASTVL